MFSYAMKMVRGEPETEDVDTQFLNSEWVSEQREFGCPIPHFTQVLTCI